MHLRAVVVTVLVAGTARAEVPPSFGKPQSTDEHTGAQVAISTAAL